MFHRNNKISNNSGLCGYTEENYAEAMLSTEPRGQYWNKSKTSKKAKFYLAFGALLSKFNQRNCDLFLESTACSSSEMLDEWEEFYGILDNCGTGNYQTDQQRLAAICAKRKNKGLQTIKALEDFLKETVLCDNIVLTKKYQSGQWIGLCIQGITNGQLKPKVFSRVGGSTNGINQLLVQDDPNYVEPENCGLTTWSRVGGSTGGVGQRLVYGKPDWYKLVCLLERHVPMHIDIFFCD